MESGYLPVTTIREASARKQISRLVTTRLRKVWDRHLWMGPAVRALCPHAYQRPLLGRRFSLISRGQEDLLQGSQPASFPSHNNDCSKDTKTKWTQRQADRDYTWVPHTDVLSPNLI